MEHRKETKKPAHFHFPYAVRFTVPCVENKQTNRICKHIYAVASKWTYIKVQTALKTVWLYIEK